MGNVCRQIEEHLLSLHHLANDVKDIGHATLCSNRRNPSTTFNQAFRVNVAESKADKLIADVVRYYKSIDVNPCFMVSPSTRPHTFANSLLQAGFKSVLEEDAMVYRGERTSFTTGCPDVNVVAADGSLLDVWTDVSMKGFGSPAVLRDAILDMYGKVFHYKGTKPFLAYFQDKPAGVCQLVSFNKVGGIFTMATVPEYRRKGVASTLLRRAIADSFRIGNNLLYLTTTKGSNAERLYTNHGFQVAYTNRRYALQLQKQ